VILIYNFAEGRFSFITDTGFGPLEGARMLVQVPDTGAQWTPGRGIVVVNQNNYLEVSEYVAKLTLSSASHPKFTTAYYELSAGKSSRIVKVRPIYSMASGSAGIKTTVTVNTRNSPFGASQTDSSFATDGSGWIYMPKSYSGNFHQFQIEFLESKQLPSEAVELDGFEIDYADQGIN
jgi:hypothetical protein